MQETILIIEDDKDIAAIEKDYLEANGFQVIIETDGPAGMREAVTGRYHLILLDIMLPGVDGFEICRTIRDKVDIPILMVTARRADIDKIRSLGLGADDYVEKPFSPAVLVAKVKAQLTQYKRLKGVHEIRRISLGGITLEPETHRVMLDGQEISLPNKEFRLLELLMENPGVVFSRETLYTRIWGMDSLGSTATIPVHINRLREALEKDPSNPIHLLTVWGVGYKFQP